MTKQPTPEYGKITETIGLDSIGSKVNVERNYVNGLINRPVRRRYEYRTRVKNAKEEMTEYMKFRDGLNDDRLDPEFRLEHTKHGNENGYYLAVKCYTVLDYEDLPLTF